LKLKQANMKPSYSFRGWFLKSKWIPNLRFDLLYKAWNPGPSLSTCCRGYLDANG
jgi:hypothetical protein